MMGQYPLRNIDDTLWHAVKTRAVGDRLTVKDIIVRALRLYADRGLEALPVVDGPPSATPDEQAPPDEPEPAPVVHVVPVVPAKRRPAFRARRRGRKAAR